MSKVHVVVEAGGHAEIALDAGLPNVSGVDWPETRCGLIVGAGDSLSEALEDAEDDLVEALGQVRALRLTYREQAV